MKSYNNKTPANIKPNLSEIYSLKGYYKKVFNVLVGLFNNFSQVYITEESLALKVGCTTRHVKRAIKFLKEIGAIIVRKNSGFNSSNNYFLNDIFYVPQIRVQLASLFSNFMVWGIASFKRLERTLKKNVPLYICNIFKKNINEQWSALDDLEFIKNHKKDDQLCLQSVSAPHSLQKIVIAKREQTVIADRREQRELIKKKVMFRPGQLTPGFNSNYYFQKSENDEWREIAEYAIDNIREIPFKLQRLLQPITRIITAERYEFFNKKHQELAAKQDLARKESLKPKEYTQENLAEMQKINENNKKKGGIKGFFANLAF